MGGQNSSESPSGITESADGLIINSLIIKEIITLSYDDFLQKVKDMNEISKAFSDSSGTHLIFVIKKGTDATILWKNTVRVGCIRVESATRKITSHRFLKLRQFLRLYTLLSNYVNASMANHEASTSSGIPLSSENQTDDQTLVKHRDHDQSSIPGKFRRDVTASFIIRNLDEMGEEGNDLVECCICMERKPDVTMPCTHSYCLPCIEQWNVTHKTCPICREEVTTDDSWVISEAPPSEEVDAEVRKALAGVVK